MICDLALVCFFAIFNFQAKYDWSISLSALRIFHWPLVYIVAIKKSAAKLTVVSLKVFPPLIDFALCSFSLQCV